MLIFLFRLHRLEAHLRPQANLRASLQASLPFNRRQNHLCNRRRNPAANPLYNQLQNHRRNHRLSQPASHPFSQVNSPRRSHQLNQPKHPRTHQANRLAPQQCSLQLNLLAVPVVSLPEVPLLPQRTVQTPGDKSLGTKRDTVKAVFAKIVALDTAPAK